MTWALTYPGERLEFGGFGQPLQLAAAPAPSDTSRVAADTATPRGDGEWFGVEYLAGQTWDIDLGVSASSETEARSLLGRVARAWRADSLRSDPGAVAELTAHSGRSLIGRPRRFASVLDDLPKGYGAVVADFRARSSTWYGAEQATDVALVPSAGGGLVAPLRTPLTTTATSDRSRVFDVGGELPTDHLVFTIEGGAITDPVIEIVGLLRIEFQLALAYDQRLVVDARPWARSILRDGGSVAGARTRQSTPLTEAVLPPGRHELVLRGASTTGSPSLRLAWRDAFTTY